MSGDFGTLMSRNAEELHSNLPLEKCYLDTQPSILPQRD